MRAKIEIEVDKEDRAGKESSSPKSPYQINKARAIQGIADLVKDKRLEGISDLRDESSREGIRAVIETKRDAITGVVAQQPLSATARSSRTPSAPPCSRSTTASRRRTGSRPSPAVYRPTAATWSCGAPLTS